MAFYNWWFIDRIVTKKIVDEIVATVKKENCTKDGRQKQWNKLRVEDREGIWMVMQRDQLVLEKKMKEERTKGERRKKSKGGKRNERWKKELMK